jgi:hypothetical protein
MVRLHHELVGRLGIDTEAGYFYQKISIEHLTSF